MADDRTDEALYQAYAGGDAGAFDELYARHADWLYRVIVRQLGDAERANDVFQDTWLSLVRGAQGWRPEARLTTWIYRVARSRLIDELRRIKPESALRSFNEHDDGETDVFEQVPDLRYEPAAAHDRLRMLERLATGLAQLPAGQREVFLLWAEAQMPVTDLAQCVDMPVETVKSRLRYARAKLTRWMKDWQP